MLRVLIVGIIIAVFLYSCQSLIYKDVYSENAPNYVLLSYEPMGDGFPKALAYKGGYLYIIEDSVGLLVVDTSKEPPEYVGYFPSSYFDSDVSISGSKAYVVDLLGHLKVLDISNPATPSLEVQKDIGGYLKKVEVDDKHIYTFAAVSNNLTLIDKKDLSERGSKIIEGVKDLYPCSGKLFIASTNGIKVLTPNDMSIKTIDNAPAYAIFAVSINNSMCKLYVGGDNYFRIIDYDFSKESTELVFESEIDSSSKDVQVADDKVILAHQDGVTVFDTSNDSSITVNMGRSVELAINDSKVYVAIYSDGVKEFDVNNPESYNDIPSSGYARSVYVKGDTSYVCAGKYLIKVNVSNKKNPTIVKKKDIGSYVYSVKVVDDRIFVAAGVNGLISVDYDLENERQILPGIFQGGYYVMDFEVSTDGIYVATDKGILKISRSGNVYKSNNNVGFGYDIFITDNRIYYVNDETNGGSVIYVLDKDLNVRGSYNTGGIAWHVFVKDSVAYVAAYTNGLMVFDVSGDNPKLAKIESDISSYAFDVYADGSKLYVASLENGLVVYDISSPKSPTLLVRYRTAGHINSIFKDESLLYLTGVFGLVIASEE